ncbi:MAG: pyridine nucleotide-disulfide oxidoreductase, partial [Gammaproteobacteria bacterium]
MTVQLAGFSYPDLFQVEGLQRLDQNFLERLCAQDEALHAQLIQYRAAERPFTALEISELLLACAPHVEDFIAELFGIEAELEQSQANTVSHNVVLAFKKLFVQRRAKRLRIAEVPESFAELDAWLEPLLRDMQIAGNDNDREHA